MFKTELTCTVCGDKHQVSINAAQKLGKEAIIFRCPSVDRRYRSNSFDEKFSRWKSIDYPPLGLIEEYPFKIEEIIKTYCMGYSYPAVTSACCLAERILNKLVLKCRSYFKNHPEYKNIHNKDSFDNWDKMLSLINDWNLIPKRAIELFQELKIFRNESIHFNDDYDFDAAAPVVLNKLIEIINEVFGVINRKDLYLVFDVPGEVWVRSSIQESAFVQEFVVPHCYYAHAVHTIDELNKMIVEEAGKLGKLSDEEFINLRKLSK